MFRILRVIFAAAVAALAAALVYYAFSTDKKSVEVRQGRLTDIEAMARLCTVEIYNEVCVRDTINNKEIFAIQKQRGSVTFDIDNMMVDVTGDTVKIILPPEIVEIREATEDNSWEVIDTRAIGFMSALRSDRLTHNEDNIIKARSRRRALHRLYHDGTIARARAGGAGTLQMLMEKIYRRPVAVIDPSPHGAHYDDYH